ncbi:MAG: hypothetical protein ACI35S_01265, partial [Anaeroplasma sp.]
KKRKKSIKKEKSLILYQRYSFNMVDMTGIKQFFLLLIINIINLFFLFRFKKSNFHNSNVATLSTAVTPFCQIHIPQTK